jgi:catalase
MFIRFSTAANERSAANAECDIRGFAVKFYSEEGNWDLACNPANIVQDRLLYILCLD